MYVHNIDPFAVHFWGDFGIRWYGLAYLSGFVFGGWFIYQMAKRKLTTMPADKVSDFVTYNAMGVLGGGRVGYCLFYQPDLLFSFSDNFPFWGVLEVHRGGMASHGGMMGVALACWLFGRKHQLGFKHLFDLTVVAAALAFFFGRLANFINGELYGREIREKISWAVKFPQEMSTWTWTELEKLNSLSSVVEALSPAKLKGGGELVATAADWKTWVVQHNGQQVYSWINYLQAQAEIGNAKVLGLLEPVLTARYPSQLIQAGLEGLMVFVALNLIWLKPRKPGVMSSWFAIFYGIARIIGEYYRKPDAHLGFQLFGLTRGQWLSIGLVAMGVLYMVIASRSKDEKMGGWLGSSVEDRSD